VFAWGLWEQDIHLDQIVEPGYTLCWAAKWHGEKQVFFDSVHKSAPRKMLTNIHKLMDEADAIVHYNGTKFDIPTLSQEFLQIGLKPPSPAKQIDILLTVRKQFRFPSNKLDYVAQALGLGSKLEHKGMRLWRDCMDGKSDAWKIMEKYNKQDVLLLEKVYNRVLPWIKNHPNRAAYEGGEHPCPSCGSGKYQARGYAVTTTMRYQRFQCRACGAWYRGTKTVLPRQSERYVAVT